MRYSKIPLFEKIKRKELKINKKLEKIQIKTNSSTLSNFPLNLNF